MRVQSNREPKLPQPTKAAGNSESSWAHFYWPKLSLRYPSYRFCFWFCRVDFGGLVNCECIYRHHNQDQWSLYKIPIMDVEDSETKAGSQVLPRVTSFSIADILKKREDARERRGQAEALDMRSKSLKYRGKHLPFQSTTLNQFWNKTLDMGLTRLAPITGGRWFSWRRTCWDKSP